MAATEEEDGEVGSNLKQLHLGMAGIQRPYKKGANPGLGPASRLARKAMEGAKTSSCSPL